MLETTSASVRKAGEAPGATKEVSVHHTILPIIHNSVSLSVSE